MRRSTIEDVVDPKRKRTQDVEENITYNRNVHYKLGVDEPVTFFVGSRQYSIKKRKNYLDKLYGYIEGCFDSIASCEMDFDQSYHKIILQFIFAIAEYNNKLNFICNNVPVFIRDGNTQGCSYIIVKTALVQAECVWYQNDTFIFHEMLIKAAMDASSQYINIQMSDDLLNFEMPLGCATTKDSIEFSDATCISKLAILFKIAEHAAIHLFEGINTDFITHNNFGKSCYTTSSVIKVKQIGNIKDLLTCPLPEYNIFTI
jgi:hypothetical protein